MADEEEIIRLTADQQNRAILSALNDAARPLTVTDLAAQILTDETNAYGIPADENELEAVQISLHHTKLPQLDEAGLITYNRDENLISYKNYPSVEATWINIEMLDELLSCIRSTSHVADDTIGVIEGRENVIEYARHLTEEAEEEVFCINVSEKWFEEACLRQHHAADAIDRGVNVAFGSTNPEVRERVREHLPEATVWEPQLDWMHDSSPYPTVGRLVFTDREKILVGVLTASDINRMTTETAIVGEGKANPLVILVRELLGPRLDHLDYQSDDFLDEHPFEL